MLLLTGDCKAEKSLDTSWKPPTSADGSVYATASSLRPWPKWVDKIWWSCSETGCASDCPCIGGYASVALKHLSDARNCHGL